MGENGSLLGRVVTWIVIGIIALVAIKLAVSVLGMLLGTAAFLLFTVGPILLVGWLLLKAWKAFRKEPAA